MKEKKNEANREGLKSLRKEWRKLAKYKFAVNLHLISLVMLIPMSYLIAEFVSTQLVFVLIPSLISFLTMLWALFLER